MFNLVYASTATRAFSRDELLDMLEHYRRKNATLGITGLLLYKQGSFMQALEGEESVVRTLYATIREDKKHHNVITLVTLPVAARQFPDWSMGFNNLDESDAGQVSGYTPYLDLPSTPDELSWQASVAMNLLATFKRED